MDHCSTLWYQSISLTRRKHKRCLQYTVTAQASSKTARTESPYSLYRRPLAADQNHTVPLGNHCELCYRTLPSYTQHSSTAVSKLSSSSALHFCISASLRKRLLLASTLGPHSYQTAEQTGRVLVPMAFVGLTNKSTITLSWYWSPTFH